MNLTSTLLIAAGLFLGTGVYSFAKQGLPRGVIVLLALASALCLVAGVLRLEVW
ncbi:hypothetical protein RM844_01785 [Streptomyces sp. DSM 44915]|uniref:Amidotransferase n=1 Tax=Streptomyces chisholmiae TaxID=3075540 RepID=A0ABU2JL83_9ACTN|nr:hypothetical protein [Streptomyces sp. DSM 44915]MDT0265013.1 hypothetical protein [Streptomyces sp. DSM 44915]